MLEQALRQLDPNNDDHWTADGLPRLDVVRQLSGASTLTRDQVSQAAPGFDRAVALAYSAHSAPDAGAATVAAPPDADAQPAHVQAEPLAPQTWDTELLELQQALAAAEVALNDAQQAVVSARKAYDAALDARGGSPQYDTPSVAIGTYLQRQLEEREARGRRLAALASNGEDLKLVHDLIKGTGPSPLDLSTAQRNRAAQRQRAAQGA